MADADDDIEALLRTRRITPLSDAGFTERLVARLPRGQAARRWAVPTFSVLGLLLALPTLADARVYSALGELVHLVNIPALMVVAGVLAVGASGWALLQRCDTLL